MGQSLSSDVDLAAVDAELVAALKQQGPMNLDRAREVMDRHDLRGLVLADPRNVFHVTGFDRVRAGEAHTLFALVSRDPRQAPGLVITKFMYYFTYSDAGFSDRVQPFLYVAASDELGPGEIDAAIKPRDYSFPDRGQAPLTELERRRGASVAKALDHRAVEPDAGHALVRAMREMGLWGGRIGYDEPVVAAVCENHGFPGDVVPAGNIVSEIRLIKSPLEIRLMSRASQANIEAVRATAASLRAGLSYRELRTRFYTEAMKLGNKPVAMTIDRVTDELADGRIVDGQAFYIDAVSHYRHYHGDYGRTVFVGEPSRVMQRAVEAVTVGWEAVRERLRPGLRYSEIAAIGAEAVRKGGYDFSVAFGPHSVGLLHADDPGRYSNGFLLRDDIVLQEGMILSVDCPVVDVGLGGSAHLEDLSVITADGAERIHSDEPAAIVL